MEREGGSVYVVDDDKSAREAMVDCVRSAGYPALGFCSAREFLTHPRRNPASCLVLDVELPELSGLELQDQLLAAKDQVPIVFVTGYADVPMSVRAMRAGAIDFLTKPFDDEALLDAVRRAFVITEAHALRYGTKPKKSGSPEALRGIVGSSPALSEVVRQLRIVAPTETTVLVQGETGTGKENIARAVHDLSGRTRGAFVKVNCAAIPAALLESELMGHERGAFTGAVAKRVGRFELAHDGTIFLDEVGEMPLDLQPKLLRVLQEREFERLGGVRTLRSNARVVAATNRDLRSMVSEGTFRQDLYYRLSVFPIEVPPLRQRKGDIEALAGHFVEQAAKRLGRQPRALHPGALTSLLEYSWPGNIRELQNVIERAVLLSGGDSIEIPELDPEMLEDQEGPASDDLAEVSRAHIVRVLQETNWVVGGPYGAAARLKMKRSTLNFRMKKLGITRPLPSTRPGAISSD